MKLFKTWFPYFIILGPVSFTFITTIIGYNYAEHAAVYKYYNIIIALTCYLYVFYLSVKNSYKFNIYGLILALVFVSGYFFSYLILKNKSTIAYDMWTYYIIWALPAYLLGMVSSRDKLFLNNMWKSIDLFMLVITIIVVINGVYFLKNGRQTFSTSGTVTYQTISYLSAFAFGLNYFLLIDTENTNRAVFFRKNIFYKIFSILLLFLQGVSLVVTGGRGGFILLVVYFFYMTFFQKAEKRNYFKIVVVLAIIAFVTIIFTSNNKAIDIGLQRIFSYITDEGIDMSETSYRDVNYKVALDLISQRPAFGYGIYGLYMYTFYPHNIVLEILLGGGICYLILFVIFLVFVSKKFIRIKNLNKNSLLIFLILLYDLVMLMFSGTYLSATALWFFIGFVINYRTKKTLIMPLICYR